MDAWNAGDREAWLGLHTVDAEHVTLAGDDPEVYRGREGLCEVWDRSAVNWERFEFAIVGDPVAPVVEVEFAGVERLGGSRLDGTLWLRVAVRDGCITRLWTALDPSLLAGV